MSAGTGDGVTLGDVEASNSAVWANAPFAMAERRSAPMKYSLDDIRTFLAVVESGSISGAALRLELTKSVVSQRVTHLEAALGVELLHRSSRGVTPTDRGRLFHEQACDAIAQLEQAAEAVAEDETALGGLLRISAPMTFGTRYLGPMLFAFMQAHPRLELALDLTDRLVDVAAEGYDLAIRITQMPDDALLVATKLADSRRVVCCSPDYARQHGVPQTLDEIPAHAGIGYALKTATQLWRFPPARHGEPARTVTPRQRILTNNGEAMRDAAVAGLGLVMLPLFIVADDLRAGRLMQVLGNERPEPDTIYAVYPQRRHRLRRLSALVAHLRAGLAGVAPWEHDCPIR